MKSQNLLYTLPTGPTAVCKAHTLGPGWGSERLLRKDPSEDWALGGTWWGAQCSPSHEGFETFRGSSSSPGISSSPPGLPPSSSTASPLPFQKSAAVEGTGSPVSLPLLPSSHHAGTPALQLSPTPALFLSSLPCSPFSQVHFLSA